MWNWGNKRIIRATPSSLKFYEANTERCMLYPNNIVQITLCYVVNQLALASSGNAKQNSCIRHVEQLRVQNIVVRIHLIYENTKLIQGLVT